MGQHRSQFVCSLAVAMILVASVAHADRIVLDDFNRSNGPVGPSWTVQAGSFGIESQAAVGSDRALMTRNNAKARSISADVRMRSSGLDYVALVLGFRDVDHNLFLKIQDQDNQLGFESFGLYFGNNGMHNEEWPGARFEDFGIGRNFQAGRLTATLFSDHVTLSLDANFDGRPDWSASAGDLPASLGTGIGIGQFSGLAEIDNFSVSATPEPSSVLLIGTGVALVGRRHRRSRLGRV